MHPLRSTRGADPRWILQISWCATGKRFKGMADPRTRIKDEISSNSWDHHPNHHPT